MPGAPDLTWEIRERANQALVATLAARKPGASVTIGRGAPRAAQVDLASSDPASTDAREGDRILRVGATGFTDPLFVGRITQRGISFDGANETITVNALDPWVQLARAIILQAGIFPAGIRSYRAFLEDQVAIIRDLSNAAAAANHTGIAVQSAPPIGPNGTPGTVADDAALGTYGWTSPSNAKVNDGAEANANVPATPTLYVDTHLLRATNFGLNVPSSATITGIKVRVACRADNNSSTTSGNMTTNDRSVRLRKSTGYAGSDKASAGEWSTGSTYREYGGPGDLWGTTWTPAEVNNAGFGAAIAAQSAIISGFGIAQNFWVDSFDVVIYWTAADGEQFYTPAIRSVSFPAGGSYGDAIGSIFALEGAPEYELTPKAAVDGTLAQLDFFSPRQGTDKTATIELKIGTGDPNSDDDNLTGISFTPSIDGLINQYTLIGDANGELSFAGLIWPTHPTVQAKHQASIDQYGVWEASEAASGVTDYGMLAQSARAMVGANAFPAEMFSCDLDPDTSPVFSPNGDFWMGDVISLTAELPDQTLNLEGRVAAATFTEDEDGDVQITISCEPDHDLAGVTSTQLTTVVDASDGQVPPPPEPAEPPEPPDTGGGKGKGKKKKKKKKH